jgi:nucleotide-binding universal stress UspA family protein
MYKKVIIPLDGSKLAEVALDHLDNFGHTKPEIFLISVTEEIKGELRVKGMEESFVPEHPDKPGHTTVNISQFSLVYDGKGKYNQAAQSMPVTVGKMASSAALYLREKADALCKKGFDVTAGVLVGNPAGEIVRFAEEQNADLIIMASRGKSGFSRWEMGNIADKVIRASKCPVLLVKPDKDFKEAKPKRRGVAM